MERENQYSKYYKNNTIKELKEVVVQVHDYEDEARLAAFLELKNRGETFTQEELLEMETIKNRLIEIEGKETSKKADTSILADEVSEEAVIPNLYSPTAILGFTILFSVLFGGILMFLNLRKLNKKATAINVLLITVGFMFLGGVVAKFSGMNQWLVMLVNIIGGIVLIEFFWKKHIGNLTQFNRKSILKPAIISVVITLGLAYLIILLSQLNLQGG